jgi:hypothetical protein
MSRLLPRTTRALRPHRLLLTPTTSRASSTFQPSPSPPRLPADQQAEFERLQRAAEEALHTHTSLNNNNPLATSRHTTTTTTPTPSSQPEVVAAAQPPQHPEAAVNGEATFSGGIRKGAPPEFEGDKNPRTGEVGGPKNEPLRWGAAGDYSYNGRVTDF